MPNVLEIVIRATDAFSRPIRDAMREVDGFGSRLRDIGGGIAAAGVSLSLLTAPAIAGLVDATQSAIAFDTAITNIRSLTGQTTEEFAEMKDELLELGSQSIAGPQAVAEAMYDIVSGVSDASTHMAILEASIATAEAGAAELTGTTAAMVSVMNAYRLSAAQAGRTSDILTRIVGVGVGTMDEFAAAIPTVTGVAAQVGEEFEAVGAQLAFLTTQGYTASVAATQIRSAFTALLSPNETMREQLEAIGFSSGSAALEQLGLVEVYRQLSDVTGGSVDALTASTGSVEALQAVLQLTTDNFRDFNASFEAGVDGATAAAQEIQRSGAAAQFELLAARVDTLKVRVGDALVPALLDLANRFAPIVEGASDWAAENPQLVAQNIQLVGGVALLGVGMTVLGSIISGVGSVITLLSGAIGVLTSAAMLPLAGIIAVVGGLFYAYQSNILGFRDRITELGQTITNAGVTINQMGVILHTLQTDAEVVSRAVAAEFNAMSDSLAQSLNRASDDISNWLNREAARLGIGGSSGMQIPSPFLIPGVPLPGRAMGGMVTAGAPFLVGERGPELFVPSSGGRIEPHHALVGGDTYNLYITLPTEALESPERARAAGTAYGDAFLAQVRRNGGLR